ncbi:hypothetical protein BGZ73_000909 [Actinomortierella ambigua]|nr:hypothetical protein BGZ73_000909 [Actinomortierella ambigua]
MVGWFKNKVIVENADDHEAETTMRRASLGSPTEFQFTATIALVAALLAVMPEQVAADDCGVINPPGTWHCCKPKGTSGCSGQECFPNKLAGCPRGYVKAINCCAG